MHENDTFELGATVTLYPRFAALTTWFRLPRRNTSLSSVLPSMSVFGAYHVLNHRVSPPGPRPRIARPSAHVNDPDGNGTVSNPGGSTTYATNAHCPSPAAEASVNVVFGRYALSDPVAIPVRIRCST